MSDIGLFPPGAAVWILSFGWILLCALGLFICLLVAWLRARRAVKPIFRGAFFGWAIGAAASAAAGGISMLLVNESGSLGKFSRWIDQSSVTWIWLISQAALWPVIALLWNRVFRSPISSRV